MELPFFFAGGTHADDADCFGAQGSEYYRDHIIEVFTDATPTPFVRRQNQRIFEESFIEVGEIQMMIFDPQAVLRLLRNSTAKKRVAKAA